MLSNKTFTNLNVHTLWMDPKGAQEDLNVKHGLLDASKYNKGCLKADWVLLVVATHSAWVTQLPLSFHIWVLEFITAYRGDRNAFYKSQPPVNKHLARPLGSFGVLLVQIWRTGLFVLTQIKSQTKPYNPSQLSLMEICRSLSNWVKATSFKAAGKSLLDAISLLLLCVSPPSIWKCL